MDLEIIKYKNKEVGIWYFDNYDMPFINEIIEEIKKYLK